MKETHSCPKCGTAYLITDELFDIPLQCSICHNTFTVPGEQTTKKENQTVNTSKFSTLQKMSLFCRKYKKRVISYSVLVFVAIICLLILPLIIQRSIAKMPKMLLQYGTVVGTPLQRVNAFKALAIRSILKNQGQTQECYYYFDKGLAILDKCEESVPVLLQKIYFKYRGDISGWVSPESERLIKLDKSFISNHVIAKYRLNNHTENDYVLLKEYEQHMLNMIKEKGMQPGIAGALGRFYLNDELPYFPHDWKKAEYYFEKTIEDKRFFSYIAPLIFCYALQGKYDKMEATAEKYMNSDLEKHFIAHLANIVFEAYTAHLRYQKTFAKTEKNYEKALKWKKTVLDYNPSRKRFLDDIFNTAFPENKTKK